MTETNQSFEVKFAREEDQALLLMASSIINTYAEQGIMLAVTLEQLEKIAAQGLLALAITPNHEVIGSAAITFEYPDGRKEFGGWAVDQHWIHSGVGKELLQAVLEKTRGSSVIAFANKNSGPIFKRLGAPVIDQSLMHPDAFTPCETCLCLGKDTFNEGQKCIDIVYDLTPLLEAN